MKLSCIDLTSVPDMVFEAQRYKWGTSYCYHVGTTYRTDMPENAFIKVSKGIPDKLFSVNWV